MWQHPHDNICRFIYLRFTCNSHLIVWNTPVITYLPSQPENMYMTSVGLNTEFSYFHLCGFKSSEMWHCVTGIGYRWIHGQVFSNRKPQLINDNGWWSAPYWDQRLLFHGRSWLWAEFSQSVCKGTAHYPDIKHQTSTCTAIVHPHLGTVPWTQSKP